MRGIHAVVVSVVAACSGSGSSKESPPATGSAATDEPSDKRPPCESAGRIDVTPPERIAELWAAQGEVLTGEKGRVLVPKELYDELGDKARNVLAKTAPVFAFEDLTPESERMLREVGEKRLLQLVRDAQSARGDRAMGSFAIITNYPLVMDDDNRVRAILEHGATTSRRAFALCVEEILAGTR